MTKINSRRGLGAVILMAVAMAVASPARAESVARFYHGKALTIIVSAAPGTPSDIASRQFARYFVKYVPGHPSAVVMNVTGAGGMIAANSLETKQPSDGTVIALLQRNNLYVPLLNPNESFDPRKVHWLGSINEVRYCIVAMTRSGVTSADDLFKKKLVIGATGFANDNRTLPALLDQQLGAKLDIVPGYRGRGDVYLAMQRGEVNGWASTIDGLTVGPPARWLAAGKMKVLLLLGWDGDPAYPNVPNLSSYVKTPQSRALFDFFLLPFTAGRPIAAPSGVPQDRLNALRLAFTKTMEDPGFIHAMKSQGFPVSPVDGQTVEAIVNKLYASPASVVAAARKLRGF